jgi:voltage-gated potassium channel
MSQHTVAAPLNNLERREAILLRLERLTEVPLLILSFVMIPLILGPYIWDLQPKEERLFAELDAMVWGVFAVDMAAKIAIAPRRLSYIRSNWLEVLAVAVPFFRPLRIIRVIVFGLRAYRRARRLAAPDFLLAYALGVVIISASVVLTVEQHAEGSNIKTFGDAVWWGFVTVATVGYGDKFPVTPIGRGVGVVLMLAGIGFFSAVAANLAALLVKSDNPSKPEDAKLVEEVRKLREEVHSLRNAQGQGGADRPASQG